METCILAVDLGTSGCKTALVTTTGKVLGWKFIPVTTHLFPNGGAEQDPSDWWNAFLQTAKDLLADRLVNPDNIAAICCSTQGEGTVPVDANGNALMNTILWMDSRGAEDIRRVAGGGINISGYHPLKLWRWLRLTGGAPSLTGKDPSAHMLYIRNHYPRLYEHTHKFLNVLDYMNLRLTGRCVATSDSILTSWVTDNRDPNNIQYSDALVAGCGIDRDKFPEIVRCTDVIGTLKRDVADALALSEKTPVVGGAIDNTASAIGSGAVTDYQPHLYIGTSSWLAAHVPFKKTDIFSSVASVPCAIPGRYLMMAMQSTAGGNLTFLRDKILYHKDDLLSEAHMPDVYKIMDQIAEKTPAGSNGVLYLPWIYGERSPVEDSHVRAALVNLSLSNSRQDIIRAFLEGVALNTRWLLGPVEKFLGRKTGAINIVGGGATSRVWCQIFADVMGRSIRQVKDPIQANVRGAAFIAAAGLGLRKFEDIPSLIEYQDTFQPSDKTRQLYDAYFSEFVAFYNRNKKMYRNLNK